MAHRRHIHSSSLHYGQCCRILESWSTKYIQCARRPCLDKCIVFRWFGLHECKSRRARYTWQTSKYAIRNYKCVYIYTHIYSLYIHESVVVLTTVWVELMSDPRLFKLRQRVMTRDHRLIAAVALFLGAFVGRSILGQIGTAATMGVGVGFRVLITLSWIFVPSKPPGS